MEYTIDYCKNNKVAVHCESLEQVGGVVDIFNKHRIFCFATARRMFGAYNCETCLKIYPEFGYAPESYYRNQDYTIIPASTFIQDNTPRLYTEAEVLEHAKKAFDDARETDSVFWTYENFEDYKQTLNLK